MKRNVYYRDSIMGDRFTYLDPVDRYLIPPEEPLFRFNIIGSGIIGMEHIRITLLEGRATINGIFDESARSAQAGRAVFRQFRPDADLTIYESLETACNDPRADALIICTPNYTHLNVLKVAAQSGKPILLEKPMATTVPDAFEIVRMSASYPAFFQVGLQYRYKAIYQEAIARALSEKAVGGIKTISILEHRPPFLDKVKQWNKFSKYSGGTLVEKCCHYFDLFNYFSQSKPEEVYAVGDMDVNFTEFEYQGERSDILDNAFVTVRYGNGIKAMFNLCMFSPLFYEEVTICGETGRLRASEKEDFVTGQTLKTEFQLHRGGDKPSYTSEPHYPELIERSGHNGATFFEHVNFIENLLGNPVDTVTANVQDGFWSVVVGSAAELSVREHRIVRIDEMLSTFGIDPADPLIAEK
jgi:predicted dehydrogenase